VFPPFYSHVHIYICIFVYFYLRIHRCIYTYIYTHMYIHTILHTYMHAYKYTHRHLCIFMNTYVSMHMSMYVCIYLYICILYIYIYTHTHIHIYTQTYIYICIYVFCHAHVFCTLTFFRHTITHCDILQHTATYSAITMIHARRFFVRSHCCATIFSLRRYKFSKVRSLPVLVCHMTVQMTFENLAFALLQFSASQAEILKSPLTNTFTIYLLTMD